MGEPEIVGGGSEKERVGKGILLPSSQNNYHEDTPKKRTILLGGQPLYKGQKSGSQFSVSRFHCSSQTSMIIINYIYSLYFFPG